MRRGVACAVFMIACCVWGSCAAPALPAAAMAASSSAEVVATRVTSSVGVRRRPLRGRRPPSAAAPAHEPAPPALAGANLEFIKQLHAKQEARAKLIHNDTDIEDSVIEESVKSFSKVPLDSSIDRGVYEEEAPMARSAATARPARRFPPRLTTVSFSIVHDDKPFSDDDSMSTVDSESLLPSASNVSPAAAAQPAPKPSLPRVYSQPAKVYGEPAKIYSEPAKVYGEPAKVYGEPAKVYGEPAKVYGEPAKFYSKPASLHLTPEESPWSSSQPTTTTTTATSAASTEEATTEETSIAPPPETELEPALGEVEGGGENCRQESCKVGYVVEGRQYRKYRVEERTADGFLVGEYGVVRNEDGALRGVRYTADSDADPRLIYDALMKFLQL